MLSIRRIPRLSWPLYLGKRSQVAIWIGAASTVKLHQQTYYYALPGIPHDDPDCHLNAMHQASSEQVRSYAATVAQHLGCRHIVGEVIDVVLMDANPQGMKTSRYVPIGVEGSSQVLEVASRHVIQGSGFDDYIHTHV